MTGGNVDASARRDVDIAKDVRLGFEVLQPKLDDIADAHDADDTATP